MEEDVTKKKVDECSEQPDDSPSASEGNGEAPTKVDESTEGITEQSKEAISDGKP